MAIVGSATMTLSSSGLVLSAVYGGSGVSLSYIQNRGPQFLSVLNAALAAAAAAGAAAQPPFTSIPATASSILFPSLAGYQAQANQLCTQCFDDATAIVPYLNASGGITTVLWDGAAVANSPGTPIVNIIGAPSVAYDATLGSIDVSLTSGMPVTRGLTFSLRASTGADYGSSTAVTYWRDQAPASIGGRWVVGGTGTGGTKGTAINGNPTIDSSATVFAYTKTDAPIGGALHYSPVEASIAACFLYTGSTALNTSSFIAMPMLIGDPNFLSNGISCGISSGSLVIVGWAFDSDNSLIRFAQSVPLSASVGHYAVMVYSADAGTVSLYVDNLSPVVTSGVGRNLQIDSVNPLMRALSDLSHNNTHFQGSVLEIDGWNVALTSTEISQVQAWLKSVSGL